MEAKRLKLDTDKIEQLSLCPICAGIPEKEIYQCSAGHVICHICITKVTGGLCPQCRVRLWENKIRCRMMEQLLDAQRFPCKFSDEGCSQFLKREEITSHSIVCNYNPELIPHCEQVGSLSCKFKFGACSSRADIICHFSNVHGKTLYLLPSLCFRLPWKRMAEGSISDNSKRSGTTSLISPDDKATSPLFMHHFIFNQPAGFLSFFCVQLWNSGAVENYKVEYSFNKGSSSSGQPQTGNSNSSFVAGTNAQAVSPVCSWTTKVYDIKEAAQIYKEPPIMVSIPFLKANLNCDNSGDCFFSKISRIE